MDLTARNPRLTTGRRLVTNSSDRTLRQFTLPTYSPPNADREYMEQELEPTHKFSDPINRIAWHAMSFSPDGEWLAGGAADPASHKIYIWDIANDGQLASTLDGGREPLIYVHVCGPSGETTDNLKMANHSGTQASLRLFRLLIMVISSSGTAQHPNAGVHLRVASRKLTRTWSMRNGRMNSTS
jgi:WD40 repeat protein